MEPHTEKMMTPEEWEEYRDFSKYINTLELKTMDDIAVFVRLYYDDFIKKLGTPKENLANAKYLLALSKWGSTLLIITEYVLKLTPPKEDTPSTKTWN